MRILVATLLTLCLVGCAPRRPKQPPLPPGVKPTEAPKPEAFAFVPEGKVVAPFVPAEAISLVVGPTNLSGMHVEYWASNKVDYGHCCPIVGLDVAFPTETNKLYTVEVRDSLDPIRVDVDPQGRIWGFSRVNLHDPPPPGGYSTYLTNNTAWKKVSNPIPGTGDVVHFQCNLIYTQAVVRIKID